MKLRFAAVQLITANCRAQRLGETALERKRRDERERTLGGLVESVTRLAWRRYSDVVHNVSQYNIRRVRQRLKPHRRYTGCLPHETRPPSLKPALLLCLLATRTASLCSRQSPHDAEFTQSVVSRLPEGEHCQ